MTSERQTIDLKVIVGGSIEDDTAAFVEAWHQAERGQQGNERILAFESWRGLLAACEQANGKTIKSDFYD